MRTGSPVRRRESTAQSDPYESSRPRLSPTQLRSYDPNHPEVLERQRTMDVDMAMQLSRARRETISSPGVSPYENPPIHSHSQPEPKFTELSLREQHDIDVARGERTHLADNEGIEEEVLDARDSIPVDLRLPHLNQGHDPSLIVSLGPPSNHADPDDPSASMTGLPTYQANVSRSNFDFSLMETFAVEEKASLGISSPTEPFPGSTFRRRNTATQIDTAQDPSSAGPSDVPSALTRSARQRKLSQSNSNPRQRKGIGGKMALFEGNAGEPPPTLPGRLMGVGGPGPNLSAVPSTESMAAIANGVNVINTNMSAPDIRPAGNSPGLGGILNSGHDRPYRFSFYSNALSATIHARSLSELPAEGQSFEDLFNGTTETQEQTSPLGGRKNAPSAIPTPVPIHPSESIRRGQDAQNGRHVPNNNGGNGNYFSRDTKNVAGHTSAMVGAGGEFEGNTWWLDVQSPTDEEMRMLSKVSLGDPTLSANLTGPGFFRSSPYIH